MGKLLAEVNPLREPELDLPLHTEEVVDTELHRMTCQPQETAAFKPLRVKNDTRAADWRGEKNTRVSLLPSCKKVRSFLTTGNSGMMGGCMLWLLSTLRYLAMFLEGSKTSCRSPNSFSYLLGNFSHELRSRATGAKLSPLCVKERGEEVAGGWGRQR